MKMLRASTVLLGVLTAACNAPIAPDSTRPEAGLAAAMAKAAGHTDATGTFTQTSITSLDVRSAGPNTVLEQTSEGTIDGTLSGTFEDELRVVIHPNGRFSARFTISCSCEVAGKQGVIELVASDAGQLASPDLAEFQGRAVLTGGSGELTGLRGILEIAGSVDVPTGLATYGYSGSIHFQP